MAERFSPRRWLLRKGLRLPHTGRTSPCVLTTLHEWEMTPGHEMAPRVRIQLILMAAWSVLWVPPCWRLCVTSASSIASVLSWSCENRRRVVSVRVTWWTLDRLVFSLLPQARGCSVVLLEASHRKVVSLVQPTRCSCFHMCAWLLVRLGLRCSQMQRQAGCLLFLTARRQATMCFPGKTCVFNFMGSKVRVLQAVSAILMS